MDDEYDNHAIRPLDKQLASLQQESVNSILEAIKYHIGVSRMLKAESPEAYEQNKREIILSLKTIISNTKDREILRSVFFDLVED